MKPKHKSSLRHLNPVTISNLTTVESVNILGGVGTLEISVCVCDNRTRDKTLNMGEGDPDSYGDGLG